MYNGSHICPNCGTQGYPKSMTSSSFVVELLLWFIFLGLAVIFGIWLIFLPLGFSIWRGTTTKKGCGNCGQPGMVPIESPAGTELVERYHKKSATAA